MVHVHHVPVRQTVSTVHFFPRFFLSVSGKWDEPPSHGDLTNCVPSRHGGLTPGNHVISIHVEAMGVETMTETKDSKGWGPPKNGNPDHIMMNHYEASWIIVKHYEKFHRFPHLRKPPNEQWLLNPCWLMICWGILPPNLLRINRSI